ncbi:prephenate dehydrogenase [Candidatus Saccharibacteria bacterium]|nr:prephenate dehydrogenase [Candidatus Saccharibacteria bacterium]
MTFGIVGYGSFGKLLAENLASYGEVLVYSKRDISSDLKKGIRQAEIEEVAKSSLVILSTTLDDLEDTCKKIAPLVDSSTIVADVCSVKVKPAEIMERVLGGKCQLLATHPLFGPQTIKDGQIKGQKIVIHPIKVDNFNQIKSALRDFLRLEVIEMTPEDHDREIAWVHGLTFFVGRALLRTEPPKSELTTGYYQKLMDLVELESSHSIELFKTVELGNPYAEDVRQRFTESIKKLNDELKA